MPLVILLLTCLLLAAAQGRIVRMQRAQLGTLKALGYSTWELVVHELALPAIIALAGSVLGVLTSILTMRPLLDLMVSYFSIPLYVTTVPWPSIIFALVAPVALPGSCGCSRGYTPPEPDPRQAHADDRRKQPREPARALGSPCAVAPSGNGSRQGRPSEV